MGNVLPEPVTATYQECFKTNTMDACSCAMNGYRIKMEDRSLLLYEESSDTLHALVLDGHGGDTVANFIVDRFRSYVETREYSKTGMGDFCQLMDDEIGRVSSSHSCGSTMAYARITGENGRFGILVSNVGDSRTVLYSSRGQVQFATQDHKPTHPCERERIVRAGGFVKDGRVNGRLEMSRAFGDTQYKSSRHDTLVTPTPDVNELEAFSGEFLVLGSDGLFGSTFESADVGNLVASILSESGSESASSYLVKQALECGSRDNITALVVHLTPHRHLASGPMFTTKFHPGESLMLSTLDDASTIKAFRKFALDHEVDDAALYHTCLEKWKRPEIVTQLFGEYQQDTV